MKKYEVVDFYDRPVKGDVVGVFNTREEANREARRYSIEDCDGECDVEVREVEVWYGRKKRFLLHQV